VGETTPEAGRNEFTSRQLGDSGAGQRSPLRATLSVVAGRGAHTEACSDARRGEGARAGTCPGPLRDGCQVCILDSPGR
jgi:hypothetical protein